MLEHEKEKYRREYGCNKGSAERLIARQEDLERRFCNFEEVIKPKQKRISHTKSQHKVKGYWRKYDKDRGEKMWISEHERGIFS